MRVGEIPVEKKKRNAEASPLQTVDAETLLALPLAPVRFIVEGLLPQGLHILAGSPKVGKSWLVLGLCLKVALGEPAWEYQSNRCTVLYLCLEDTYPRIQQRLFQIADSAPDNLHFSVAASCIAEGLEAQIEQFVLEHPETGLIAIDTLQMVRSDVADNNAYAQDYRVLLALKGVAEQHKLAILLVHHLRKQGDDDPFNRVSGTTGLTGAVDGSFVLVKDKRSESDAKLFMTGRDIEYQQLTLRFEDFQWQFVSRERESAGVAAKPPPFLFQVVEFIHLSGNWQGSATELLGALQDNLTPPNTVTKLLNQHKEFLLVQGIRYSYKRLPHARTILLCAVHDSNDGYDGSRVTATVS